MFMMNRQDVTIFFKFILKILSHKSHQMHYIIKKKSHDKQHDKRIEQSSKPAKF